MDISQMRKKFADNDERFPAHIRQLLADAPCDAEYRTYLLNLAEQIYSEMRQIQAELLDLVEATSPPQSN